MSTPPPPAQAPQKAAHGDFIKNSGTLQEAFMKWEQRVLHEIEKPPSVSPRSVFRESANELRWVPTLLAHGQTSLQLSPDPSQAPRLHASRGGFSVGLSPQDQSGG